MTDLTIDEAEAWRAGYRAALADAALACRQVWADTEANAERLETAWAAEDCLDAIRALPIPNPPPMADGLCGRGA